MPIIKSSSWLAALCFCFLLWTQAQAASLPDFTSLVEEASPSVVNISTVQKPASVMQNLIGPNGQPLPDIFEDFFGRQPRQHSRPAQSLGSGFIISADGYILTNNHVVGDAAEIMVRLSDRRELSARLVGADERSDLALLKVDAKHLPTLSLGDSSELKAGQWVLAIGSPFGFDHSVTAGIVSALGRSLPSENYVPFIQTDVAINPGNSGGPLFNLEGEVVGINSQIFTRSGGFMGLSFAIPMEVALQVVEQLKDKGYVSRGWLGVAIQDVSHDLAESFGLAQAKGALVAQVLPGGPAEKAGLREGDVITHFDGHEIVLSSALPHAVGAVVPGTEVELKLVRNTQRMALRVSVGTLAEDESVASTSTSNSSNVPRLGVSVETLGRAGEKFGVEQGVVVSEIQQGTGIAVGLRVGDLITHLNNHAVDSPKQFKALVEDLPAARSVSMRVVRQGRPGYISFKLAK